MEIAEQVIAQRIRELRQRHRLTLQQVSEKAGLSKSFLSKVERCNVSISVAALSRLATGFGVSLGEFFDTEEPDSDVIYVPSGGGRSIGGTKPKLPYEYEVLVPRRGVRQMQPVMISVNGRTTKFELREHPGEQFIFMLEGEINYVCGNREFTLRVGDCLYFNARMSHGPKPKRNQKARYLAVFTSESPRQRR
jgi:transcriptional regulator with XRE-family HTH domain